jgi:hypothetical protein
MWREYHLLSVVEQVCDDPLVTELQLDVDLRKQPGDVLEIPKSAAH